MKLFFLLLLIPFQDNTPFKAKDEFELKMDYQFRQRANDDGKVLDYREVRPKASGPLPYLTLDLRILKMNDGEERIRIYDNKSTYNLTKKLKDDLVVKLDLGYTDDIKDRVTSHEYVVLLMAEKSKQAISKIVIHVEEDGSFIVNGEERGRL
jgi:hypothetical protein